MKFPVVTLCLISMLQGCSTAKPVLPDFLITPDNPFCRALYQHNDWLDAAVDTENRWGVPIHISLAELNMPIGTDAAEYIRPVNGDWEEYRLASENWSGSVSEIETALDFIGWHAETATDRNVLTMDQAGQLYIASRIGHGGYYRLEYYPNLLLERQGEAVDKLARQYRADLKYCPNIRERAGSFFRWPW